MEMADWVSHTQGAPWGTGFKSGYADWIRGVETLHGNSRLSPRTAYLYKLVDQDGNFLKWGITQDLNTRYPKWYMEDKKIFRVSEGSRAEMLRLERELVETQPGPWNHEPWAGKRKP
jgi:hypothetical protein